MLGSNVPTVGGLPVGFRYGDAWGCKCIQVYVSPSRRWHVPELTDEEIRKFRAAWEDSSVSVVVAHVPFLVNLASSYAELRSKSISRLIIESDRAARFGVQYLVLHPGSNESRKKGLELITEGLDAVLDSIADSQVRILLETVAGQGNSIGWRFEELAHILARVQRPERLGICFDTCHVFAAGYDLRGYKGYEDVLGRFDETVGLNRIEAIHINDSKTGLGSRVDRHTSIGDGFLGLQAFHAVVQDARFTNTPKILEIPKRNESSEASLELLKKLEKRSSPVVENQVHPSQLSLEVVEDELPG